MNYLAHAYLSFEQPALITGNMIADFVKGQSRLAVYDPAIQAGIRIHRAIDTFTDQHPLTLHAKQYFRASSGLYSGVFVDLVYDHFLATDPEKFTAESLHSFARNIYSIIRKQEAALPPAFMKMFGYMEEYDWLYGYHYIDGIFRSMKGLVQRAKYLETDANIIYAVFMEHYEKLKACYQEFFPELQQYVEGLIREENRQ
jgi:acyl carrier protein phosphodiesterase